LVGFLRDTVFELIEADDILKIINGQLTVIINSPFAHGVFKKDIKMQLWNI